MGSFRFSIERVAPHKESVFEELTRETAMPIIDVSQKSYRSLVKAAHKRGMSIDRFIQQTLENSVSEIENEKESAEIQFRPSPRIDTTENQAPRRQRATSQLSTPTTSILAFDDLWKQIEAGASHSISTKRGQYFTYEITAGYLSVVESGVRIPKSQFKKALDQWPQSGPSNMRGIYAASIVWAVLADERILVNAAA